jgi:cysteine-rich repeat protein
VRIDQAGAPDPSFGSGGYSLNVWRDPGEITIRGLSGLFPGAGGLVLQPDGSLIVASENRLSRLFGGTCGNGTQDAGEDCDDGNTLDGDGCDAHCCTTDADGDGVCDAIDTCVGPTAVTNRLLVLSRLGIGGNASAPNDEVLTLIGRTTVTFPVDPLADGVRFQVDNAQRAAIDVTIPGGPLAGVPPVGWTVKATRKGRKWTYVDKTAAPLTGIDKAIVEDELNVSPTLKFTIKGKKAHYQTGAAALPVTARVLFAAGTGNSCAEADFAVPAGSCMVTQLVKMTCR